MNEEFDLKRNTKIYVSKANNINSNIINIIINRNDIYIFYKKTSI